MIVSVPPSCHSTRLLIETSRSVCALSSGTITSVLPRMCRVGVEYEVERMVSLRALMGLNPAAAIQNVLRAT